MTNLCEFLDLEETAAFLRIKPATLYVWVHQRRIPYRKHGGRLVFYKPDLLDWSEKRQVRPVLMSAEPAPMSVPQKRGRLKTIAAPKGRSSLKTRYPIAEVKPFSLTNQRE